MQHVVLTDPKDDAYLANGEQPVLAPTTLTGSADALTFSGPAEYIINSSGVDAITLTSPTSGGFGVGHDGAEIFFLDAGGHAHTITCGTNKIVPSHHLITFNGTAGSWCKLKAIGGVYYPLSSSGVTIS